MHGFKKFCEISKGTFKISQKILNPYIAKYAFQWVFGDHLNTNLHIFGIPNMNIIENVKTTSMKNDSTGVLVKIKSNIQDVTIKPKTMYDVLRHIQLHMSKYQWNNEDLKSIMSNLI